MIKKTNPNIFLNSFIIIIGCLNLCLTLNYPMKDIHSSGVNYSNNFYQKSSDQGSIELKKKNISLYSYLSKRDTIRSRIIVDSIIKSIKTTTIIDSTILSESYYFVGYFHLMTGNLLQAISYLTLSGTIKEKKREYDELYAKGLYNLGIAYSQLGDFNKLADYSLRYLDIVEKTSGDTSKLLIRGYSGLVTAYIQTRQYEKSINSASLALDIVNKHPVELSPAELATLYNSIGVCYVRLADYSKARNYLEKTEYIYKTNFLKFDPDYVINLFNTMAITYGYLGLKEKSGEYYEKGINLAESVNSSMSFNLVNSYAIELGNNGNSKRGESLLANSLIRAQTIFGFDSREYIEVLKNYAEYLREYKIDNKKSMLLYLRCFEYLNNHQWDQILKEDIRIGYALSLKENGEADKALVIIQELLFPGLTSETEHNLIDNPSINYITVDRRSLKILKAKHEVLWDLYNENQNQKFLDAAASTSELMISVLEKIRLNISEEESRMILGDNYRNSYLSAIHDFNICYNNTFNPIFLEKAYEYMERSKVGGLLTSTRELKATFQIPVELSDLENKILREISLYYAKITDENNKEVPDNTMLARWNDNILIATQKRDSIIRLFEKNYPEYYAIKYNTQVVKLKNIPEIIGRNNNYLNYVVSDTMLYIFIVNRKHQQLLSFPIDSPFFKSINKFYGQLSISPSSSVNATTEFLTFQKLGNELYQILVDPVLKYLVSDRLIISPDNMLSYLPFEIFLTRTGSDNNLQYRNLYYLMNDFRISYTYSATLMAESKINHYYFRNKLIAFAPVYSGTLNIDSLLLNQQAGERILQDLPFARQEAEYVSILLKGKLYLNKDATESAFKSLAGKFDIIHLAMHTLLNDKSPMYSKMVFYRGNDTINDGFLNTYEIYGIPLKTKMVVLSSCNTGLGSLHSGEGILSLARGFIYSGSQSVVMSMWKVEDKSGTEIVNSFYRNLKRGNSKSEALRKARINYLKKADQLRSHPYFWSSLIVYGNVAPLYYSKYLILIVFSGAITIICLSLHYFKKRKYS
jgi:CHAT domain-containing protein